MEEKKSKQGLWGFVPVWLFIILSFRTLGGVSALSDLFLLGSAGLWVSIASVISVLASIIAVYLLVLFFKKSKKFPMYFNYYIFGFFLSAIVIGVLSLVFPDGASPVSDVGSISPFVAYSVVVSVAISLLFYALIVAAIIISVKKSERVRLTFVN